MALENDTKIDDAESDGAPDNVVSITQPSKKRGRKPGGKNSNTQQKTSSSQTGKKEKLSARQITGILFLGHQAAANALKEPALAISENEAALIADAAVDVLQYYDFEASAKTVAWCNLFGTLCTVYGVRVWSMMQQKTYSPIVPAGYQDDISGD